MRLQGVGTIGLVALVFGLASFQVLAEWNAFNVANVVAGGALAALGGLAALRRLARRAATAADATPVLDALLLAVSITWGAILLHQGVALTGVRFDWTFERRFELSPAIRSVTAEVAAAGPVELTLYIVEGDPRRRATRLLLQEIARTAENVHAEERDLDRSPEEEDFYGIGSSNSVVLRQGARWELVERPTEGALYEALARLRSSDRRVVYVAAGTGEGDFDESQDAGFTGLRAALEAEGYAMRPLPTAAHPEIPDDAEAVLVVAPQRKLTDEALAGLRAYLEERGGRLVAFLEPGHTSGVEEILAEFGLASPDALVVDPASGAIEDDAPGMNPITGAYGDHPVARELDSNRMTFFRRARAFTLRKPRPHDRLAAVVYTSGDAWLSGDTSRLNRAEPPERPQGARGDYLPLVVAGHYERGGKQVRIVAFGDASFASNRYLRALYNLDLALNAVHWVTEQEAAITLRPKTGGLLQFPVPIQTSLNALYGVGLLVPELLVMAGAWVWLRRRSA
jgi:hypothetical protein